MRDAKWKLNQKGELFDMSRAPFEEVPVSSDSKQSAAGRGKLQAALTQLNPAGGILDQGDGSGRHAGRAAKEK